MSENPTQFVADAATEGRSNELKVEKETGALKKLQAAAGFVSKTSVERLDWMYEQAFFDKPDNDKLMNTPVADAVSKDLADVKSLQESTAGSLFLKSATKTTEDMLRKLREDPLFQIRRQEEAARANMLANPLVVARLKNKAVKESKKALKKAKKADKKQKKALKKLAKAQNKLEKGTKKKKKKKKGSSSSSSDDSSSSSGKAALLLTARSPPRGREPPARTPPRSPSAGWRPSPSRSPPRKKGSPKRSPPRRRGSPDRRSPPRRKGSPERPPRQQRKRSRSRSPVGTRSKGDAALGPIVVPLKARKEEELGPSTTMVNKREEYEATVAQRKEASLASRGAPRKMSEEEKHRRLEQMQSDAQTHERSKDLRIANAERRDKEIEDAESKMRVTNNQSYFKEIRQEAYTGDSSGNLADRIRNQRGRRQKNLNDPLERDEK